LPLGEEGTDELQRARDAAEERRLVAAAVAGSSAAFESLYRRHVPRIYALCLRLKAGDRLDATELLQDVFVKAWRRLDLVDVTHSYRQDGGNAAGEAQQCRTRALKRQRHPRHT